MLSLSLVFQFPLGPSLCCGSLLRPGGRLSRLLRPGGRLSRLLRPGGRLSRLLRPGGRLSRLLRPGGRLSRLLRPGGRRPARVTSRLRRPARVTSRLRRPARVTSRHSGLPSDPSRPCCLIGPTWTWPSVPSPGSTSAPPPSWSMLCVKRLEATLRGGGGSVLNLVATHYYCTSPMDYISHHALHSHIPIHHYTNHTAVTIHSSTLIVSPHLHLIHTHTYKQLTSLHSPRSLVLPRLTF